ncbi:MAG: AraC family transcriptional regulator [Thermomicrobiales bacterium]
MPSHSDAAPRYREIAQPPALRDLVACVWVSEAGGQPRQTMVLPDGCIDLIWPTGSEPFVAGPMTRPLLAHSAAGDRTLGVRFLPAVAPRLLHAAAAELLDSRAVLADVLTERNWRRVRDVVSAATDAPEAAACAGVVAALAQGAMPAHPFVEDAARWLARHPAAPVSAFFAEADCSERHLRRHFAEHVGYGPKMLQRILRLQRALWLASHPIPPPTLARLAHAAGYADQAHMTREMQTLAGQPPSVLLGNDPQSAVADLFKTPPA